MVTRLVPPFIHGSFLGSTSGDNGWLSTDFFYGVDLRRLRKVV